MSWPINRTHKTATFVRGIFRDVRGTAVLEMAILTPVLLTIGIGVMELGNLIYQRHLIVNGVHDAARYMASVPGCDKATGASLATKGTIDGSGPNRVENWSLTTNDIFCIDKSSLGNFTTLNPNVEIVRIRTEVSYAALSLGMLDVLANLGADIKNLTFLVSHEERYYGGR